MRHNFLPHRCMRGKAHWCKIITITVVQFFMKPSINPRNISHLVVQNAESQSPFSLFKLDILDLQLPHSQRRSYRLLCHIILCRCRCAHLCVFSNQYAAQVYLFLQRKSPKSLCNSMPSSLLFPTHRLLPSSCVSGSGFWQ